MLRHVFIWSVSKQRMVSITTLVSPRLDLRCLGQKIYSFWKDSFKFSCVKSASVYNPTVRSASASNTWLIHATLRSVCLCMCGACTMCVDIHDVCACVVMCIHIWGTEVNGDYWCYHHQAHNKATLSFSTSFPWDRISPCPWARQKWANLPVLPSLPNQCWVIGVSSHNWLLCGDSNLGSPACVALVGALTHYTIST